MEPLRSYLGTFRPSLKNGELVRGFTLVELLVVLAIIVTITTIALTSQSAFNKTLIVANTAYDIGLTLRSAETYGLGSRAVGAIVNAGYGLHFQSGSPGSFILFADTYPAASCGSPDCKSGDNIYSSGSDSRVQTYALGNGIVISDFCAYPSFGNPSCMVAHGGGLPWLDIVFARPNPDASIIANGFSYATACVTVSSPQGGSRGVSVTTSGQIIANLAQCP